MKRVFAALLCAGLFASAPLGIARAELVLAMFERAGCIYCRMWDDQIAPIWPRTAEGAMAPLRRIDLDRRLPDDIRLARRPVFTPTFVLLRDGVEVARLEGYPGEDFFWGLIGEILRKQPEWAENDEKGGVEG
ncbi:thioredoxin family protein [Rhodovulum tesquicola]|uniref:thioredoxin family protein n=1 Tax=Rhodovulum tesquicola TaxID=540254 RepID=UPI0020978152|nr:thioredoxin family protein [Rhodovulum tesquicola]MCO8145310.1 thioredoxin family protein [Rhodovulum tesquicola]